MQITPELQKKIDASKRNNQRRKADNEWGGLCLAVKVLVAHGLKSDARILIRNYLKEHQIS